MATRPLKIIIIGGSLAGLKHGIALKRLGHDVTILEQDLTSEREGQAAGIVTMEYSHKYLTAYDKLQAHPYAVPVHGVQNLDQNLQITSEYKRAMRMSSWNVLYNRLRANFDGLTSVYNAVSPDEDATCGTARYEQGKRFTHLEHDGEKIKVFFDDLTESSAVQRYLYADLVIAADGSTSAVRRLLQPHLEHRYVGYVAWRGTVLESDVTETTLELINQKTTLCTFDRSYIAVYIIPGESGTLEPGRRLVNYVWYTNLPSSSLSTVMTDADNRTHRLTLPIGKMRPEVWSQQVALAKRTLPAPFAELISKTTQPFISAIVDIPIAKPSMFGGELLFVGDVLCAFRPHVASSGNQAAYDAMMVVKLVKGEIGLREWEAAVVGFANRRRLMSVTWGDWYMNGMLWFAVSKARHLVAECMARAWEWWRPGPKV